MERSFHETIWLACPTKRCCTTRTVVPTGADIYRIAVNLQVPPERFLRLVAAPAEAQNAVYFTPAQPPQLVALARRAVKADAAACIFLLQLGEQATRCGLDMLRPMACQLFPASEKSRVVRVTEPSPCTCREWSLADLDRERVVVQLAQANDERERYQKLVQVWNAEIKALPLNTSRTLGDFGRYLLTAYAQDQP